MQENSQKQLCNIRTELSVPARFLANDAVAATAAATLQYQHPRQGVESCDLRKELEDRTGKGGNNVI